MNVALLRKIYRKHGIRKKVFRWTKSANGMNTKIHQRKLVTMKQLMTRARNDGYRTLYCDETMFTRSTMPQADWSLPKENYTVD